MKFNETIHSFEAIIQKVSGIDAAYISVPFDVEKVYSTKANVKVKVTFDGHPYRGLIANMGNGHCIGVRKDIREAIGKSAGDTVTVTVKKDTDARVVKVSPEIQKILTKNSQARSFFNTLSYTNQKEYVLWISSAKKTETKEKRLSEILTKLLAGKKNPSEK